MEQNVLRILATETSNRIISFTICSLTEGAPVLRRPRVCHLSSNRMGPELAQEDREVIRLTLGIGGVQIVSILLELHLHRQHDLLPYGLLVGTTTMITFERWWTLETMLLGIVAIVWKSIQSYIGYCFDESSF